MRHAVIDAIIILPHNLRLVARISRFPYCYFIYAVVRLFCLEKHRLFGVLRLCKAMKAFISKSVRFSTKINIVFISNEVNKMKTVKDYVTSIPDFPEPGIIFRDITSVIGDADGLKLAVDQMQEKLDGVEFDVIAGLESRGFLFGMPIAYNLGKPFIPVRKKGKLPRETVSASFELEYGTAEIEIHKDDVKPGTRVVLIDDLIATGGTLNAAAQLFEQLGASVVKIVCLLELKGLNGRQALGDHSIDTVISYEGK